MKIAPMMTAMELRRETSPVSEPIEICNAAIKGVFAYRPYARRELVVDSLGFPPETTQIHSEKQKMAFEETHTSGARAEPCPHSLPETIVQLEKDNADDVIGKKWEGISKHIPFRFWDEGFIERDFRVRFGFL